jgi:hypothetical protein
MDSQLPSYLLNDAAFVDSVLETGVINFLVRGRLWCDANFGFEPFVKIRISGPTYKLHVYGETPSQDKPFHWLVNELNDDAIFPGEITIPEKTKEGIGRAVNHLEIWADFLCLATGNPKLIVEIQRPLVANIQIRTDMDVASLDRWSDLTQNHVALPGAERQQVSRALWWYRKACVATSYSVFDGYTARWNCLEILCGVSGSQVKQEPSAARKIQDYLKGKKSITPGHIQECFNRWVNYSIAQQMRDVLSKLLDDRQAAQIVRECFEVTPEENRLYQIRNDINHGNILENSAVEYERVYMRGTVLLQIVMKLLYRRLGYNGDRTDHEE